MVADMYQVHQIVELLGPLPEAMVEVWCSQAVTLGHAQLMYIALGHIAHDMGVLINNFSYVLKAGYQEKQILQTWPRRQHSHENSRRVSRRVWQEEG